MRKSVSIVEARRDLGRLADEVRRTGRPIVLTRRGRAVARIAPEPAEPGPFRRGGPDAFASVRGSIRLSCGFRELQCAVRELRGEYLARRGSRLSPPGVNAWRSRARLIDTAPLIAYLGGAARTFGAGARRMLRRAEAGRLRIAASGRLRVIW